MPSSSLLDLAFSSSSPQPNGTTQPHSHHQDYSTDALTRHHEQPHRCSDAPQPRGLSRSFSGPAAVPASRRPSFSFQLPSNNDNGYAFALSPPRTPPFTASHRSLASPPHPFPLPPSPPPEALTTDPVKALLHSPLTPFFMPSLAAPSNGSTTRGGARKLSRIASAPAPLGSIGSIGESSTGTMWSLREGAGDEAENGWRGGMGGFKEGAFQDVGEATRTGGGKETVRKELQVSSRHLSDVYRMFLADPSRCDSTRMTFSKADDFAWLSAASLSLDTRVRTLADKVNILQASVHGLEEHTLQRDREYEDLRALVVSQQQQQYSHAYPFPPSLPHHSYTTVPFESCPVDLAPPTTAPLPFNPHAQPFTLSSPVSSNHSHSPSHSFSSTPTRPYSQPRFHLYATPSPEQHFAFSESLEHGLAGSPVPRAGQGSNGASFSHAEGTVMHAPVPRRPVFVPPQLSHRQRHPSSIAERALRTALGESFGNGAATAMGGGARGPVVDGGAMGRTKSLRMVGGSGGGGAGGGGQPDQHDASLLRSASLGLLSRSRRSGAGATPPSCGGGNEQINYRVLLETDSAIDDEAFVRRILVQNDQQCSLFLQQRVRRTTPENREKLCEAVGELLLELSFSKFGNFLVSRCLDAGDLKLAQSYSNLAVGHFLELALDPFGCHVVQKLIDCGDKATKERVIEELMLHPTTLTQKNAAHVWNRLLTTPNPPAFYQRLAAMGQGTWADVVRDDGGSLIVQHVLEGWPEAYGSAIAKEVLEGVEKVAKTACGSFVLSQFLERNALPFRAKVMELAPRLSTDNFGAKIVERCFKMGRVARPVVADFVEAITSHEGDSHPPLLAIASHATGAQLLSHLLSSALVTSSEKSTLARCIVANRSKLLAGNGTGAAKLMGMVEKITKP
ncbi:hypothetical protein JCM5296_004759 [Sporobolomyces johnsonii]